MSEYSFIPAQTVSNDGNVFFVNGGRACRKGFVSHRDNSGLFLLRGVTNQSRAVYRVTYNANIAIATGGTVEPISLALTLNGETLGNTLATVTPAAIGDFFAVSGTTFIDVPCGCCVTVALANESDTTAIDVSNANIVIDRVA